MVCLNKSGREMWLEQDDQKQDYGVRSEKRQKADSVGLPESLLRTRLFL
jgi:hypothetical protein